MKLRVEQLPVEDAWKDIVRIRQSERFDQKGRTIGRGSICLISVGGKSKWVIAHGLKTEAGVVKMDQNVRTELDVNVGEACEFTLRRIGWMKSLWFPWKASDPIYRIPAQLGPISFVLGLIGLILGVIPFFHRGA